MYWYTHTSTHTTINLYMQHVLHTFLSRKSEPSSLALPQVFFYLNPVLLIWLSSQDHLNSSGLLRTVALFSCTSSHVHLVAAHIFTLTLWSWHFHSCLSPPFVLSRPYLFLCVSFIALAKRTKASTQHCDWTKFSTSPLSWTAHWSVKPKRTVSDQSTNVFELIYSCQLFSRNVSSRTL